MIWRFRLWLDKIGFWPFIPQFPQNCRPKRSVDTIYCGWRRNAKSPLRMRCIRRGTGVKGILQA